MSKSFLRRRLERVRGGGQTERFGLESLEGRQLLASDLAVSWDTDNFRLPAVLVPGDRFDPDGGTNRIEAPILIVNLGPNDTDPDFGHAIRIDFYLSTDTTLGGTDTLLRSYTNEAIGLPVYNNNPDNIGTFSPDMRIPPTVEAGTYYLIARIVPNSAVQDFNSSNNIAVSDDSIQVRRRFGSFDGRTNVMLASQDAEQTIIAWAMSGGGYGEVVQTADGFAVTLFNSGNNSIVSVTHSGGDGSYDFTSLTINGSVGTFSAPSARLRGPMTATTGFGAITLGDVLGPRTITVPNTSVNPTFVFGNVTDLVIGSAVGIESIRVTSWRDADATRDRIEAPWVGGIISTGNIYLDLDLAGGRAGGLATLGNVTIGGVIKQGQWKVVGDIENVSAYSTVARFWISASGRLESLSTVVTMRAKVGVATIGTISAGKDILASRIFAGADFGDDGVRGGMGANADSWAPGTIDAVMVTRNVANAIIAAGLDPIDDIIKNGNDVILGGVTSRITTVDIGNIAGMTARFLAGAYTNVGIGGSDVDWRNNSRFVLSTTGPQGSVEATSFGTVGMQPYVDITVNFASTSVMSLAGILDGTIKVTGPAGFEAFGVLQTKEFEAGTHQRNATAVFRVFLADPSASPLPGMYQVEVVGSTAPDDRGNFAIAGNIGSFTV